MTRSKKKPPVGKMSLAAMMRELERTAGKPRPKKKAAKKRKAKKKSLMAKVVGIFRPAPKRKRRAPAKKPKPRKEAPPKKVKKRKAPKKPKPKKKTPPKRAKKRKVKKPAKKLSTLSPDRYGIIHTEVGALFIGRAPPKKVKKAPAPAKSKTILNFTKTYHGTIHTNVRGILSKGLDVRRSRGEYYGIHNSISVTDNPLLAKSMTRGETGQDKEGKVFVINKRFRIIDLRDIEGKKYWEDLDRNPVKAIKEDIDGVAFEHLEDERIKYFYKDIQLKKVRNALEIQIFKSIEPKYLNVQRV